MTGKGSTRRPTDEQKFSQGWDAVFGKKEPEQVCSSPFCECPINEWLPPETCSKGLPWKKEEMTFAGKITMPQQTCGSCKHFSGRCEHLSIWNMIETDGGYWAFEPPADFGCNQWEEK